MPECMPLTRQMLHNPIGLRVDDPDLDFPQAEKLARQKAKEVCDEPMLLAWFDRVKGVFSPNITCCREDKPSWLTYAESRGGNIVISINDEDYVFVFRGSAD
ncbi:MAG: AF1514 family protein [Deltaproteobacteria bacterium]|nr:AF1514 family protein [Deltaproteobacteria bacterium]